MPAPVAPCVGRRRPGADVAEARMRVRVPPSMSFRGLMICPSARLSATGCRLATTPCRRAASQGCKCAAAARPHARALRRPPAGPVLRPRGSPRCPLAATGPLKKPPRPLRAAPPDRRLKAKPPFAGSGSAPAREPPEIAGLRGGLAAAPAGARQGSNNAGYPNRDVPCFGPAPKS